jgi:adenosylcobinamide-GDP ribazoletransferase
MKKNTVSSIFTSMRLSLAFLTRLPVGRLPQIRDNDMQHATAFFPLAGYLLALLTLIPVAGLSLWITQTSGAPLSFPKGFLLAALTVAALAWLTRGLHLDGLADMADGFGGGFTPEKRLEIMKDPRTGSFGVAALSVTLLVKTAALASLLGESHFLSCAAALVLSRLTLTLLTALGHYPRQSGTAGSMVGKIAFRYVVTAVALATPVLLIPGGLIAAGVIGVVSAWVWRTSNRLIGGITGDVLGACCELSETLGLATMAIMIS